MFNIELNQVIKQQFAFFDCPNKFDIELEYVHTIINQLKLYATVFVFQSCPICTVSHHINTFSEYLCSSHSA